MIWWRCRLAKETLADFNHLFYACGHLQYAKYRQICHERITVLETCPACQQRDRQQAQAWTREVPRG